MHWSFLRAESHYVPGNFGATHAVGDVIGGGNRCDVITIVPNSPGGVGLQVSSYGREDPVRLPMTLKYDALNYAVADFDGDGRADIFSRDFYGQWYMAQATGTTWKRLQSSSLAMNKLRFGDFNGDKKTDVLAVVNGSWHISSGGTGAWRKLNSLSTPMPRILIGDFTADGVDDIIKVEETSGNVVRWAVSVSGRSQWQYQGSYKFGGASKQSRPFKFYVGRFDAYKGADILIADHDRHGYIVNRTSAKPRRYSRFAY